MLKTTMLAAFAAISVCAMAQDFDRDDSRSGIMASGKNHSDIVREVWKQTDNLPGGDVYLFANMMDRMPANTQDALISGLFAARRQAVVVRDQIIATRFADNSDVVALATNSDHAGIMAEENEDSIRPMRMVMQGHRPVDIDYDTALDILTVDLNPTQKALVGDWWNDDQNELQKDVIVKLLKIDARKADEPIYPSLYVHHVYGPDYK